MKKFFTAIIIIALTIGTSSFATVSSKFQKTLELMNVPAKNKDGYEINEEMYNKYNLIVYGKPQDVTKNQRWKDVNSGKWTNETTGKTGEYRILGYSLSGTVVNNENFPDDYVSGKSPEEWNYIVIDDALSSWNDTEDYQTKEQIEYMLNQKLSRNGTQYNLTAKSIGLDKARLEAYATWKTAGSIFTLKNGSNGLFWGATFNVPPMAADAQVVANLEFPNGTTYMFSEKSDTIEIPFTYGAEVINLTEFAKAEHIKNITSEIEIQYTLFDKITGEKTTKITKENKIIIDKNKYSLEEGIHILVRNTAVLETLFSNEAPLVDIKEVTLNINCEEEEKYVNVRDINKQTSEEIPRPRITSIELYRKESNGGNKLLNTIKKTNNKFICAGQVLIVKAKITNSPTSVKFYIQGNSSIQTLDELTKRFVYDEPKQRNEKLLYSSLSSLKNSYNLPLTMNANSGFYEVQYVIPYQTKQTVHSWNTLRNLTGNALEINTNNLFSKISGPYVIKIRASNDGGTTTKSVNLDVFERWDTVYNRDISEYIK